MNGEHIPLSTEAIIYAGVGIYLVVMLIIGIWASSRNDSTDNFIVAERSMPIWLASATSPENSLPNQANFYSMRAT